MALKIRVGNLRTEKIGIRVDRVSSLGNPFEMGKDESLRDSVCDAHQEYFDRVLAGAEPVQLAHEMATERNLALATSWKRPSRAQFIQELDTIASKLKADPKHPLLCWCSSQRCHADHYAQYFERSLSQAVIGTPSEQSALLHWQQTQPDHKVVRGDLVLVSGGQTGADRGGLLAAKALGIKSGGYAPALWLVEGGNDPGLKDFGLLQAPKGNNAGHTYLIRTELNLQHSDGTVVLGSVDPQQDKGSFRTVELAKKHGKPCFHAEAGELIGDPLVATVIKLRQWIIDNDIKVLNVAGNRGSKAPQLEGLVVKLLRLALNEPLRENLPEIEIEGYAELPAAQLDPKLKTIQYRMLIDPSEHLATVDDRQLFGAIEALVDRAFKRATEQGFPQVEFVLDSKRDSPGWIAQEIAKQSQGQALTVGIQIGLDQQIVRDSCIVIALTTGRDAQVGNRLAQEIAAGKFVVVYSAVKGKYESYNSPQPIDVQPSSRRVRTQANER